MKRYLYTILVFSILGGAGGGYGGFLYGERATHNADDKATRTLAIEHGCGEYGAKDGIFHWDTKVEAIDITADQMLPLRKPEPKKKSVKPQHESEGGFE